MLSISIATSGGNCAKISIRISYLHTTAKVRRLKAEITYRLSGLKYFSILRSNCVVFSLLFFIFPSAQRPISQTTQARKEHIGARSSMLMSGEGPKWGSDGGATRLRPLSNTGERRQRSTTNLDSTVWLLPSVRIKVKLWRMTHFSTPKAHTAVSPPQVLHWNRTNPVHNAKVSMVSKRKTDAPQTKTSFIFIWCVLWLQETETDPGTTNIQLLIAQ